MPLFTYTCPFGHKTEDFAHTLDEAKESIQCGECLRNGERNVIAVKGFSAPGGFRFCGEGTYDQGFKGFK